MWRRALPRTPTQRLTPSHRSSRARRLRAQLRGEESDATPFDEVDGASVEKVIQDEFSDLIDNKANDPRVAKGNPVVPFAQVLYCPEIAKSLQAPTHCCGCRLPTCMWRVMTH